MWNEDAFTAAGFSPFFYDQLKYMAHDEEGHVTYLQAGLIAAGAAPVAACEYTFSMTTPYDFVKLASVIEGVGVSAYLGAAADITSKAYLTAAGSILVTEALHKSATRGAVSEIPFANVFGTPLGLNAVYSIAAPFFVSCPSTNQALSVKAYPSLALASGLPTAAGAVITVKPESIPTGEFHVTFVSGLDIISVKASCTHDGYVFAVVPKGVSGQSYVFLTSDNSGAVTDATVIAGPAIVEVTPEAPTFILTIT
jgi:hypothetical protein